MKCITIRLNQINKLNQFICIVNRFPYEMDLRSGCDVRDAKSVLGVLSLDLKQPLSLEIHHDNCDTLLKELSPFIEADSA